MRGAPDLVVEMLSPGNSAEEMAKQCAMYARSGVAEYAAVNPATRVLRYYRLAKGSYGDPLVYAEMSRSCSPVCLMRP
ncbi:MAG: Uma2 family endonuclease [Oscillochloridaceae bacterium]|nr:Uma2 family endonuclease [Chloroflexaceae bacterium]MDW8389416.1 Uma2 family endonuclease [Oscillochloridaceae bacterium]